MMQAVFCLIAEDRVHISRWHGYAKFGMDYSISETGFAVQDIPALQEMWQTGLPLVKSQVTSDDFWVTQIRPTLGQILCDYSYL